MCFAVSNCHSGLLFFMHNFLNGLKGACDTFQSADVNICVTCDQVAKCINFFNKKSNETYC